MEIDLPTSGCNIINSATTFYNYSTDSKTRKTYIIFDGQPVLQSENYNQYGYSYTGTCLHTGDLLYKPELEIYFQFISAITILISIVLLYNVIFKRFLK